MITGITHKRLVDGKIRIALMYPGTLREALSSLGFMIIYDILNREEDVVAHIFTVDSPLSLEERLPIRSYDYILTSLHFEPRITTLMQYLRRLSIPLEKEARKTPIYMGGPGVWNPLPFYRFVDGVFLGDGEDTVRKFLDLIHLREDIVLEGFYNTWNEKPTTFSYFSMKEPYYHIISDETTYGERPIFMEVNRGCHFACRFCLIGWADRPPRERPLDVVYHILYHHLDRGGKKIVFIGSDVLSYSHIEELLEDIVRMGLELSVPSSRIERLDDRDFLALLSRGGLRTLTVAPESAYNPRKTFIAKPIPNEKVLEIAKLSKDVGIRKLKLYFMIGYPDTSEDEVRSIIDLYRDVRKIIPAEGTVSIFIPKPYTPFQYLPMERIEITERYVKLLRKETDLNVMHPKRAILQALLSVGDKRVGDLLMNVYHNFNYHLWMKKAREMGIDIEKYLYSRETPWSNIIRTSVSYDLIRKGFEVVR